MRIIGAPFTESIKDESGVWVDFDEIRIHNKGQRIEFLNNGQVIYKIEAPYEPAYNECVSYSKIKAKLKGFAIN